MGTRHSLWYSPSQQLFGCLSNRAQDDLNSFIMTDVMSANDLGHRDSLELPLKKKREVTFLTCGDILSAMIWSHGHITVEMKNLNNDVPKGYYGSI